MIEFGFHEWSNVDSKALEKEQPSNENDRIWTPIIVELRFQDLERGATLQRKESNLESKNGRILNPRPCKMGGPPTKRIEFRCQEWSNLDSKTLQKGRPSYENDRIENPRTVKFRFQDLAKSCDPPTKMIEFRFQ